MFHPVSGPRTEIEIDGDTRVIIPQLEANKQHPIELPVPGLLEVYAVRVGDLALPKFHEYEVPDNRNFFKKLPVKMAMFALAQNYEGTPVLLRNIYSNDGRWQAEQKVYVTGRWESSAPSVPPPSKPKQMKSQASQSPQAPEVTQGTPGTAETPAP